MTDHSEEGRAFLQARVALFWKVIFFIILLGSGLGMVGAVARPGGDLVLTMLSTANAGFFWWLASRGERSIQFSRWLDAGGLMLNSTASALMGRYLLTGFATDQALASAQAINVADGYITMLQLSGMAMMMAIRAALIPSSPRRTMVITALFVVPMMLVTLTLEPVVDGAMTWRTSDSGVFPWLPATMVIIWGFGIITCAVISQVIYGLRAEVLEARRLGQYVIERKIGAGGMGEVYRARHGMMRRPSAIKLLRADQAGEANLARFEREVQQTARLTHPNTITIFDFGRTHDGVFYYAMELLDGATLQRVVTIDGAQPPARVVRIMSMLCGALAEAHGIGLIHRDIKPANIMLCTQGGERDVVKLLDFGLVKEFRLGGDVELTGDNTVIGTPQYMAPESIMNPDSADARSDIYALGAVAYYLLAGTDVFNGKSVVEVLSQHLSQKPEPLSARRGISVPAKLEAVVMACLDKDPNGRPQTAADLRRQIEACRIEPWDRGAALAWWRDHPEVAETDAAMNPSDARTIAIDGIHR
ncbi:MAG: serine/threonine-protein kinase [Acidobacteriota bacterium]|nr:serine/threonine-protein kinase [Acidobacteriota bacterium]